MPGVPFIRPGGGGSKGSISVTLYSDAGLTTPITTANYGQTIYINAVASGLTPTQYSFSLTNGSKSQTFNQAGATLTYVVEQFGSVAVAASARDGSTGVSVSATSTLTVGVVKNACAFDGVNDRAAGGIIYDGRFEDHAFTFWAKIDNTAANQAFFSIMEFGVENPSLAMAYVVSGSTIRIAGYSLENNIYSGAITADTDYHFYTLSYNYATKLMSVYYDNALLFTVASWDYSQPWDVIGFAYMRTLPFIGTDYGNITMKDFRIHDAQLDLATVQAMYADDTVMSGSEVQWFPFYEPIGTTTGKITDIIADRKMNLNNMTSPFGIVAP
jgi:hypothetical protein